MVKMSESWEKLCKSFTPENCYISFGIQRQILDQGANLDIYIKDNEIFDKADQIE